MRLLSLFSLFAGPGDYIAGYGKTARPEQRPLFDAFEAVAKLVRDQGRCTYDNTPGDSIAVPFTQTPGYRIDQRLDRVTTTIRRFDNSAIERDLRRIERFDSTARILKAPGLRVYALVDEWARPVFLRFDRGTPQDLLNLHSAMLSRYVPAAEPDRLKR